MSDQDLNPSGGAAAVAEPPELSDGDLAGRMREAAERITGEIRKRIIGQEAAVEEVLISLFVGGNSIITGVPGLAKTMIVQTLSEVLALRFQRIQFTPDLMPSDITGTDIIQENPESGKRNLVFVPGPVFANIVLADEINRTPPKTQSALLEAMEERQVTAAGRTHPMSAPFFVLATQNPIELEGTYPLPEAQLDRFMFKIELDYLSESDEITVVTTTTQTYDNPLAHPLGGQDILDFQRIARQVPAAEAVIRYAVRLVHASRPQSDTSPQFIRDWVSWGGGIRASQNLILAGKVRALLSGRFNVSYGDVRALAHSILRHRILLNFHAEAERVTTDKVISMLLDAVPAPNADLED